VLHNTVCCVVPSALSSFAETSWQVMCGTVFIAHLDKAAKHVDGIDACTPYVAGWRQNPLDNNERRVVCKRYDSPIY